MNSNPLFNDNRLKLGVFGFNGQAPSNSILDELYTPSWRRILEIGAIADAAGFEALVPFARWKHGRSRDATSLAAMQVFDPFVWAGGLGQATRYPAVMSTSHMSLIHPLIAAKQSATIDHISDGRFALNVVAGWNEPEFRMFGGVLEEHTDRYAQAAEWMDVLKRLWHEDEEFEFDGKYYRFKGGESFPKPIQKPFPPIMSAGGSDKGRHFAAKYADMCFTLIRSDEPEGAKADVDAFRDLAHREYERRIHVWTICYVIQRDTQAEADAYQQRILDNADHRANDTMMGMLGAQSKMMSKEAFLAFKNRYIAGAGGFPLVGSAERIVDKCRRLSQSGVDGILLCWIDYVDGLTRWIRDVMPMLEQAGLRRQFEIPR
jgi:alkanesulfonate monooxygenase SsuD/methylene tetrahydromethanopterin reductase-like flavin-dependent oxidoreductase (luciferase family)